MFVCVSTSSVNLKDVRLACSPVWTTLRCGMVSSLNTHKCTYRRKIPHSKGTGGVCVHMHVCKPTKTYLLYFIREHTCDRCWFTLDEVKVQRPVLCIQCSFIMNTGWSWKHRPCVCACQAVLWVWVSTGTHLPRLMLLRFSCPWIHPCLSAYMCCEAALAELQTTQGRSLLSGFNIWQRGQKDNSPLFDVLSD